jgi:hypothetical protein
MIKAFIFTAFVWVVIAMVSMIISLTGCISIPYPPDARGIEVAHEEVIPNQWEAMFELEVRIADHFGIDVVLTGGTIFDTTIVYWTDSDCNGETGVVIDGDALCYRGVMWSCSEMYVALQPDNKICGTALLTEYGYCLRMTMLGEHEYEDYEFWAIVQETNKYICDVKGW